VEKKKHYEQVLAWFQQKMPRARTELFYRDAYELLVAVILSSRCTDKRVNLVTPPLLREFPTPEDLAETTPEVVYNYIKSVSFPNNKARYLVGTAKMLVEKFYSRVPERLEDLLCLPGVGRKAANVVRSVVFNKAAMAVDTHVYRVSNRIGLTNNSKTPLETEKELVKNIPKEKLAIAHHWLILHGRYVCQARKPHCYRCGLQTLCQHYSIISKIVKAPKKPKKIIQS
jgi:endonuclease-3